MSMLAQYRKAEAREASARRDRQFALRALVADGATQQEVAHELGITQPAISQQLHAAAKLDSLPPQELVEAAAPTLRAIAHERGFGRLALFGSTARGDARPDSDIDLIVAAPEGSTIGDLVRLRRIFEKVLGRSVDLVTYGGLTPGVDDDILRDLVML